MKKCSKCGIEKELSEFSKRTHSIDGYRKDCKRCVADRNNKYYHKNKVFICKKQYTYKKNKLKTNSSFRIEELLRRRISHAVRGSRKSDITMNLIGCSIEQLKLYLQQTALGNGYTDFDINDYSGEEYHIDHIIPCSTYDLTKESDQRHCFRYTNLQVLKSEVNLKKSDTF